MGDLMSHHSSDAVRILANRQDARVKHNFAPRKAPGIHLLVIDQVELPSIVVCFLGHAISAHEAVDGIGNVAPDRLNLFCFRRVGRDLVFLQKRIVLSKDVPDWIADAMSKVPLQEAPITHEVALETQYVKLTHRDPADKFLAATANVFDLTLVTADRRLIDAKDLSILANR